MPAGWRLLHREDGKWVPIEGASDHGVAKDRFTVTTFPPVETDALRLEVRLQEGFSAGILELRVP